MSDVSPDLIVDAVTGFHRSAALKAGVDLGVFAAIAHGAATADEIAIRAQAGAYAAYATISRSWVCWRRCTADTRSRR